MNELAKKKYLAQLAAQQAASQQRRVNRTDIPQPTAAPRSQAQGQYKDFAASELFCPKCQRSMPVRKKLLLVLPSGEQYDYLCSGCGESLGSQTDS